MPATCKPALVTYMQTLHLCLLPCPLPHLEQTQGKVTRQEHHMTGQVWLEMAVGLDLKGHNDLTALKQSSTCIMCVCWHNACWAHRWKRQRWRPARAWF